MVTAYTLESKLSSLYKAGKIVGGVYIGRGQEALSGALGACLRRGQDIFFPLIRDQAGRTAFGETLLDATRTYLGSVLGPMRGRDGNIHRGRPREGLPAMISHLGGGVATVSGMLMARRMQGSLGTAVGATCAGDGATSTGAFHEGLNLAAVEHLPMVIVIANNQYAYSTPTERQFACRSLVDRAVGYGMAGHEVDGTDMLACLEVLGSAVEAARAGKGPQMVVASLLRLSGHGEHDDAAYVPESVRQSPLGRDCMTVAETQMTEGGFATAGEIAAWREQAAEDVQAAVATAQQEPGPDPFRDDWNAYATPGFREQT
ncbi:MAG: thiamine pyrophosphate-dependent dehydrogenase E1 component subunit alpha [Akkermansiaceae bacterium]|nr:thiamine pyrophosphate-dependent dehydrogenase E1 component subunit alpha [Akkermansiaceae bacterium]NNM31107.1 thiamine pyrophosphate-dependent dehydrogenase E1 component subunit alpha [Akkermansiaceae bacterium]